MPVCACLFFTDVVKYDAKIWKARKMRSKSGNESRSSSRNNAVRSSISFPFDVYQALESIAKEKKVSLAWVVREAAERYIAEKWPLFGRRE